ncbi:MAG: hypothetical protein PWP67_2769, partial [Clostridium butyricum]|nr:hypothetical protein [Clostridium butyricum]
LSTMTRALAMISGGLDSMIDYINLKINIIQ